LTVAHLSPLGGVGLWLWHDVGTIAGSRAIGAESVLRASRGIFKVGWDFTFAAAAYRPVRT
jgi:hypothetical protein